MTRLGKEAIKKMSSAASPGRKKSESLLYLVHLIWQKYLFEEICLGRS